MHTLRERAGQTNFEEVGFPASNEREIGASGQGWTSSGKEERRALVLVKAESNTGDQLRDFPGPFRVS